MDEALALPVREGGRDRPPDPADHRLRKRRGERHRPSGRVVLRREADRTSWKRRRRAYFRKIEDLGGVVPAIEQGFFQREITRAAYEYQMALSRKRKISVGVNDFVNETSSSRSRSSRSTNPSSGIKSGACSASPKSRRTTAPSARRLEALEKAAAGTDEPHPASARLRARLRHPRGDQRRADQGFRRISGAAVLLKRHEREGERTMADTKDQGHHRQAGARRPRPRGEGRRPRPRRGGDGGRVSRPAPDARVHRQRRHRGRRRRRRPVDPFRRPHDPFPSGSRSSWTRTAWATAS